MKQLTFEDIIEYYPVRKVKKKSFRLLVLGGLSVLVISITLGYIVNVSLDIK